MPSISFQGAKNFTISGGNFGDIAGSVSNYNFGNGFEFTRVDNYADCIDAASPDTTRHLPSRRRYNPDQRRSTASPPPGARIASVPHRSDSAPAPQAIVWLSSPLRSPIIHDRAIDQPDGSFPSSPTSSTVSSLMEYSTPPTEHITISDVTQVVQQFNDTYLDSTPPTKSPSLNGRSAPTSQDGSSEILNEALAHVHVQTQEQPAVPDNTRGSENEPPSMSARVVDTARMIRSEQVNQPPLVQSRPSRQTEPNNIFLQPTPNHNPVANPRGPPPPVPPRPATLSLAPMGTVALDATSGLQFSNQPIPRTSSPVSMQAAQEDPAARVQRHDMSGKNGAENRSAPRLQPSGSNPLTAAQRSSNTMVEEPATTALAGLGNAQDDSAPLAGTPTLSTITELSATEIASDTQPHWTTNSIESWVDSIKSGGEDLQRQEEWRVNSQSPYTLKDSQHACRKSLNVDPRQLPTASHFPKIPCYGHYTDRFSSGLWSIPTQQFPVHHPYFAPYSVSGFPLNPSTLYRDPYGGPVFFAPWSGV
ncbi:hypothetical protein D9756_010649 [Leucocoprinus leucothites]|uniref:Uncharacterized protein n=1 Tax=Leucocoprinus leucothites TaxID=201217 RepID=A0A8H5FSY3_9AGAR|nr:hypothetical protein D9756_010649 [Leucoagaricus leucothites]